VKPSLAFLLAVFAFVVTGCGSTSTGTATTGTATIATTTGQSTVQVQVKEYPAQVQHNIIVGCTTSGGTASQCRCYLKKLEAHLTVKQLAAIERATGPPSPSLAKYAKECQGA
jgi:hypothetical protein